MTTTYVKTTEDGRKVEVIDGVIYLGGVRETDYLIELIEHPNRQAILKAVPRATHMAGRLPLTREESSVAQGALDESKRDFDASPIGISERLRKAVFERARMEGVE
jgi:hypothetical protein